MTTSRIVVSSQWKKDGETDNNFTNELMHHIRYKTIKLLKAVIPLPYLCKDETFTWKDSGGTDRTFSLGGNYTSSELASALETGFSAHQTINVSYSSISNTFSYSSGSAFTIRSSQWSEKLRYILGEEPSDSGSSASHESPNSVNLSGAEWFLVRTNFFNTNLYYNQKKTNGFLVPCNIDPGEILTYEPQFPIVVRTASSSSHHFLPSTLSVQIEDPFGNLYEDEDLHVMFEFEVEH